MADSQEHQTLEESTNKRVVLALYEALSSRDVQTVHCLLAPDIEWWFHGPPEHQHMMQLLTGVSTHDSFQFLPTSITTIESTVLAEGCDWNCSVSWVHAWTVTDGIVTQVREYFNTDLMVTRIENTNISSSLPSPSVASSSSASTSASSSGGGFHCLPIWQSKVSNNIGKSVPGLLLAL